MGMPRIEPRVPKNASFAWKGITGILVLARQVLMGRKEAEPVISPRLHDIL